MTLGVGMVWVSLGCPVLTIAGSGPFGAIPTQDRLPQDRLPQDRLPQDRLPQPSGGPGWGVGLLAGLVAGFATPSGFLLR